MKRQRASFEWVFIVGLVLSRIVKAAVKNANPQNYKINNFVSLDLVYNKGISWGMFHSDNFFSRVVIILVTLFILFGLMFYSKKRLFQGYSNYGEQLVLAGATSNLLDRILGTGVVDYISIDLGFYVWPTFNLADVFIVVGVLIMLVQALREKSL